MGREKPRTKGLRYEREAVAWLARQGLSVRRTANSGSQAGHQGDIEIDSFGQGDLLVEVKFSAADRGMRTVRQYLRPVDLVMARTPGEQWLFVVKPELMAHLLQCALDIEALDGDE